MASDNTTLLQGHQIEQKRTITIKGKEAVLYAKADMASLLPPNVSQQTCLYVGIDDPALTLEAFQDPIDVTTTFSTQHSDKKDGPFEFTQTLMVRSITRLPHNISRGANLPELNAYRLDCGYANLTVPQLACQRTKAYQGSPKAVIEAALADSGLDSKDIDANQLTSKAFTENKGWYMQNGETTEKFVRNILAENGGIMFLNNDNLLYLLDTSAALVSASQYEIGATIQNFSPNPQTQNYIPVQLYNFRITRSSVPVQKLALNSHPLTKTDLRNGVGNYNKNTPTSTHQLHTVHANLPGDALNILASNLLEANTYADNSYTATTTVPFSLGEVITVKVYNEKDAPQTYELLVVASHGQHSFEAPIANTNTPPTWTGVSNGFINYELTMIDASKLPRMPIPTTTRPEIPFTAVVVDKNGKLDSKVTPAEKEIFVGLLHGQIRDANQFTTENIIPVADHIEPVSLTSSVPAPGTKVRVLYCPTTKSFTLDGRIVLGNYTMNTTLKNDSNAKQASEAWMTLSPNEITMTIGPKAVTNLTFNGVGYKFKHKEMVLTLDSGFNLNAKSDKFFIDAKNCAFEAGTFTAKSNSPAIINTLKA